MSPSTPLPWLAQPLAAVLAREQGHALLLTGPPGVGQFELALALAHAWLCEAAEGPARLQGACGQCAACRLLAVRSHPDLMVLLPEALREALGWGSADDAGSGEKASKAKPSKEIKVDAVRAAVQFAQSTSARGRSKLVVVYPAEQMNGIAANALLKTLEEPPGAARFVLATEAPDALLPTIRSRCQALPLALPAPEAAAAWLEGQGVKAAATMLAATGGQVQKVLDWQAQGLNADLWTALPRHLAQGEPGPLAGWPLPEVLAILQRVCHDAMCLAAGAAPRYFPQASFDRPSALRGDAALTRLAAWSRELTRQVRHAEHPFAAALALEAVVAQAQQALAPPRMVKR
jgi:DNA polymerase III subunit delta'